MTQNETVKMFSPDTDAAETLKEALESSSELKAAFAGYDEAIRKKKDLESLVEEKQQEMADLIRKKEEFNRGTSGPGGELCVVSGTFGDNKEDFDKLMLMGVKIASIDAGVKMIGARLQPGGEIFRLIRDKKDIIESEINQIISPIRQRYESAINKRFDELVQMCNAYTSASRASIPKRTPEDNLINYSQLGAPQHNVMLTDGMRIEHFAPDIRQQVTLQAMNFDKNPLVAEKN